MLKWATSQGCKLGSILEKLFLRIKLKKKNLHGHLIGAQNALLKFSIHNTCMDCGSGYMDYIYLSKISELYPLKRWVLLHVNMSLRFILERIKSLYVNKEIQYAFLKYTCVCMCVCIHTHIHIYTHTHIYLVKWK